jgi:hypothetical protein
MMLDVDAKRGPLTNALVPGIGTASGAMLSALLVTFLPAPTHLVYYVLVAIFALQATAIAFMSETVTRAPGALASLRPEISVPRTVRLHVLAAAPVLFAVWALAGLYGALGPALAGVILVAFAGVSTVVVLVLRNLTPFAVMSTGVATLFVGVVVTLLALAAGSLSLFFVGTAIAGAGFGAGLQGGIRIVVPQVAPHERAGVLSLLFVVSYLGFGVPAVIAGILTVDGPGLVGATDIYGVVVIVLSLLALAALVRARRR